MYQSVTVKKIGIADNPISPTCTDTSVQAQSIPAGQSPWVEYTIRGQMLTELEVDKRFRVLRSERNGVPVAGFFVSSPVTKILDVDNDNKEVHTLNSVYHVRFK